MRICFTTDLHGSTALYDQLDALISREKPDLAILGGDLFLDGELDDPLATQGGYIRQTFLPRIDRWRAANPALAVACILGNHDWSFATDILRQAHHAGRIVLLDHRTPWRCGGMTLLGYSLTPPTPYWVKDFERLDCAGDALPVMGGVVWDALRGGPRTVDPPEHFGGLPTIDDELRSAAAVDGPWMFVCHAPPAETALDRLPTVEGPLGSRAVRRFIEQRRPTCGLHGHFHESPEVTGAFLDDVAGVPVINPGQERERLFAVLFDSRDIRGSLRHTVLS